MIFDLTLIKCYHIPSFNIFLVSNHELKNNSPCTRAKLRGVFLKKKQLFRYIMKRMKKNYNLNHKQN
jgi:hypothetical protein